jgi:hypothetical protein
MATTTNYGWTTPDDTDLVKDGAAAIRTLGSSIDTTFAADEGDLLVGGTSDIFEALPIGAAGTILTSDGDTAEWAAPAVAASGLTLIKSQTVGTSVSSVAVTGAFSATYDNYLITFTGGAGSASGNDVSIQFGATTSGYAFSGFYQSTTSATLTGSASNSASLIQFATMSAEGIAAEIFVTSPFLARRTSVAGRGTPLISGDLRIDFVGRLENSTSYTDFTILTSNTMTGGVIRVYGYQNS